MYTKPRKKADTKQIKQAEKRPCIPPLQHSYVLISLACVRGPKATHVTWIGDVIRSHNTIKLLQPTTYGIFKKM